MNSKPRIIIWDLETLPNLQYAFGRWDPAVSHKGIVHERSIVCAGWMVLGEKKVHTIAVDINDPYNDKQLLIELKEVLEGADLLVAHYGDKFDLPFLKGRLFLNGLGPLALVPQDDTKFMASKNFKLNSYKLDYLAQMLGFGTKDPMSIQDWLDICIHKSDKALQKMIKYNIQDVKLLSKIYKKLKPYAQSKLNHVHFVDSDSPICPSCGHDKVLRHGFRRTIAYQYNRLQCKKCGHSFKGSRI